MTMTAKDRIHVYRVVEKAEVDFNHRNNVSVEQHQAEALQMAANGELDFKESDCKLVAIGFVGIH